MSAARWSSPATLVIAAIELAVSACFVVLAVVLFVRADLLGLFILVLAAMAGIPGALRIHVFLTVRAAPVAPD